LRGEEIKLEVAFANALALIGDFVDGKEHYDRALAGLLFVLTGNASDAVRAITSGITLLRVSWSSSL
jgi:hypothetical protein